MNNKAEALREKIGWYLDRYADGPTPRDRHAQAILTLCAEVAREALANSKTGISTREHAIAIIDKAFGVSDE